MLLFHIGRSCNKHLLSLFSFFLFFIYFHLLSDLLLQFVQLVQKYRSFADLVVTVQPIDILFGQSSTTRTDIVF